MPKEKFYSKSSVAKACVPREKRKWRVEFPEYNPPYYTARSVLRCPSWADREERDDIQFNTIDGNINRISYTGEYPVLNGFPRNPNGRTGIKGRGLLGKWGPNHAVDIIIVRYDELNKLEVIRIKRKDNKQVAFPGGMVDNGETLEEAMVREAAEEVFDLEEDDLRLQAVEWLKRNVPKGFNIHQDLIECHRNTDNAWIESTFRVVVEAKDDPITFPIRGGSDALCAFWEHVRFDKHMSSGNQEILKRLCSRLNEPF